MISCDVMSQPLRAWYSFRAGNGVPRYPLSRHEEPEHPDSQQQAGRDLHRLHAYRSEKFGFWEATNQSGIVRDRERSRGNIVRALSALPRSALRENLAEYTYPGENVKRKFCVLGQYRPLRTSMAHAIAAAGIAAILLAQPRRA